MLIRFLKREIGEVGVRELRDGKFSSPGLTLKEDPVKTAEAVKTGEAQKDPENVRESFLRILRPSFRDSQFSLSL